MVPLKGYNMVLGVHWLRTLGLISWDFSKLLMQFKVQGKKYTSEGLKDLPRETFNSHIIKKKKIMIKCYYELNACKLIRARAHTDSM